MLLGSLQTRFPPTNYGETIYETLDTSIHWYTGDFDDELDEAAYTAGTPTDDPELLEQFDGNLEDADASASQVYASASRSFQEAREFLARVKSAGGYFPVVGIDSSQKYGKPTSMGTPGILHPVLNLHEWGTFMVDAGSRAASVTIHSVKDTEHGLSNVTGEIMLNTLLNHWVKHHGKPDM